MSRVADLKQQIEELEKKTQELQKELEKEQEIEVVFPFNTGDDCFLLEEDGSIGFESWMRYHVTDTNVYLQGNVFQHAFQAEKERDRRILLTKFRHFRDKCNGNWKPDWHSIMANKYHIGYDYESQKLDLYNEGFVTKCCVFGYFKNEQDGYRAINLFGDEIKRLFVEE